AEANEVEDNAKKEKIEIRNQADQAVFMTEKNLAEAGDKIDADTKAKIEAAVARVKQALEGENTDELKAAADDLTTAWHGAAQQMYQQAQAAGATPGPDSSGADQPGPEPNENSGDASDASDADGSVDADFEVVDEDK
ncbi:MAG: Hsp70 family protein, partial [FCB group bacterium]|nr:Hsp70 family protein [FCB group bacterium]